MVTSGLTEALLITFLEDNGFLRASEYGMIPIHHYRTLSDDLYKHAQSTYRTEEFRILIRMATNEFIRISSGVNNMVVVASGKEFGKGTRREYKIHDPELMNMLEILIPNLKSKKQ